VNSVDLTPTLVPIPLTIHAKILLDFGFSFWENNPVAGETEEDGHLLANESVNKIAVEDWLITRGVKQ